MSDLEVSIKIDPIVPKTPKVHVTREPYCARTKGISYWISELISLFFKMVIVILGVSFVSFLWLLLLRDILYCEGVDIPEEYRPLEPYCEPKSRISANSFLP